MEIGIQLHAKLVYRKQSLRPVFMSHLFLKLTTGDITISVSKWNCETGIRKPSAPEYMSSCAFMPWYDNESEELGETALIIMAAKSATLAMREFLAEGVLWSHCRNRFVWRKWWLQSLNRSCSRGSCRSLLQSCLSARFCRQFLRVPKWFLIWIQYQSQLSSQELSYHDSSYE